MSSRPADALPVRAALPTDLPVLQPWLPPGAARDLPAPGTDEAWLVATGRSGGAPLACLRLRRAIGLAMPRHWYHLGCVVHAAAELGLFHRLQTLQLGNDLTGASELADIAWQPGLADAMLRPALAGLLQSALGRLRDQPPHPAGGSARVIAELPGAVDADGQSPFWRGLGRAFYDGDPRQAAQRFGPAWRSHVAALMPRQPVYSAFLGDAAQAAIGRHRPDLRPWADLLRQAGLRESGHITIDQGGPVFEAPLDAVTPELLR